MTLNVKRVCGGRHLGVSIRDTNYTLGTHRFFMTEVLDYINIINALQSIKTAEQYCCMIYEKKRGYERRIRGTKRDYLSPMSFHNRKLVSSAL